MKSPSLHGGRGELLLIIGGRIGIMVRAAVLVTAHMLKIQCITKGLSTPHIKSQDHGAEQADMQMRVRHQKGMVGMLDMVEDITVVEGMLVEGMLEGMLAVDTANQ